MDRKLDIDETRLSNNGRFEYTIQGNTVGGIFEVVCWNKETDECHWMKTFYNEDDARKEFNRFD